MANIDSGELILRADWKAYMETQLNDPGIHLIGQGFTNFSEAKSPSEYSRQYIHQKTSTTDVVGFAPAIAYSADAYSDDPVVQEVMAITDRELLGSAARRTIYCVNTWEKGSTDSTVKAWKRTYAIIPDNKGDGLTALIYSGNFKAIGDLEEIDWDIATNAPTESVN